MTGQGMKIDLRYVEKRLNANGTAHFYWIRRGHLTQRLPDDAAERFAVAERLNQAADGNADDIGGDQTVGWLINQYERSSKFLAKARSTQNIYGRWLGVFRERWGDDHPSMLTRFEIANFIESLKAKPATQHHAVVTLQIILDRAMYYGFVQQNLARGLDLAPKVTRSEYWQPVQIAAWLDAASGHKHAIPMRRAFLLLLYTAQRASDVLGMSWNQFDGDIIRLRQQKTKRLVEMPCHDILRQELTAATRTSTRIVPFRGSSAWVYEKFRGSYLDICRTAGVTNLQARDLRRTAVVNMSEAACSLPQISSITGHSIERTQQIIDTYFVRTLPQAREAIRLWQEHDANKSPTSGP